MLAGRIQSNCVFEKRDEIVQLNLLRHQRFGFVINMASMDCDEGTGSCSKEDYFNIVDLNGKKRFRCEICRRHLSSKHSVLQHLHSAHNKSKLYEKFKLIKTFVFMVWIFNDL